MSSDRPPSWWRFVGGKINTYPDEHPNPEELLILKEEEAGYFAPLGEPSQVWTALETLTPRQREALELMYGFYDGEVRTLVQTAELMGITVTALTKLRNKALRRLKLAMSQ